MFEGSVAVVTGGASGIGRATAIALARAGADVVIGDVVDDQGAETVNRVEDQGRRALYVHTDVGSRREVESLVEQAISWKGHLDLFMSNAAITGHGAPHEFSVEDWEAMLDVNLWASIWGMRVVVPHMLGRGSGHLIFVSSGAGLHGIADNAPYSVTKFALIGLAESLAMHLKGSGVGVSVVVPGAIGGEHNYWRTIRIAGSDGMPREEVERIRTAQREMARGWPSPESMARTIIEGVRARRFYIFQEGEGEHADWERKLMADKAADPDAFVSMIADRDRV